MQAQLEADAKGLLAQAEQADQRPVPDGMDLPAEIARRQERFTKPPELAPDATPAQAMAHTLKTRAGRALYALRKQTVGPSLTSSNQ